MVRRPHPALLRSDTISTARPFCLCVCCEALKRRPGEDARNLPYLRIPRSPQSVPNPVWSGWARSHAALKPRGAPGAAGGRFQLTMSALHCLAGRRRSAGDITLAHHIQLVEIMSTCASSGPTGSVRQRQYPACECPMDTRVRIGAPWPLTPRSASDRIAGLGGWLHHSRAIVSRTKLKLPCSVCVALLAFTECMRHDMWHAGGVYGLSVCVSQCVSPRVIRAEYLLQPHSAT